MVAGYVEPSLSNVNIQTKKCINALFHFDIFVENNNMVIVISYDIPHFFAGFYSLIKSINSYAYLIAKLNVSHEK